MQVVPFPARPARIHYRHELRTLTYVTLDAANGGIIRNLNSCGAAVQAVAPLREQQRVRLRFELKIPRLRVEAYGYVCWASSSGQCGIRFVGLPAQTARQIDEWMFSTLLDAAARESANRRSILDNPFSALEGEASGSEGDGLDISSARRPAIRMEQDYEVRDSVQIREQPKAELDWLSRPLSGRALAWLVDGLIVIAALLLFALIFLSIAHELPRWPVTVVATLAAAIFIGAAYWVLFSVWGGTSLGNRLAQGVSRMEEGSESGSFR
jgi:RDD family/PilZ domain